MQRHEKKMGSLGLIILSTGTQLGLGLKLVNMDK